MDVAQRIEDLQQKDHGVGYRAMLDLQAASRVSAAIYAYMDVFFAMLDSERSYVRTRALALVAANAKWDDAGKIEQNIGAYLQHITDSKPITARQCIKLLPEIVAAKPALRGTVLAALKGADVSFYADSMRPLVEKDIDAATKAVRSLGN